MDDLKQIREEYDLAMSGEAWYGDPVWKILDGIDAASAAAHPIAGSHSIWQLVMHMRFWEQVAIQRAAGPVVPDEKGNFPETPEADEAQWQETLKEFRKSNEEFREMLSRLDPDQLDGKTPGGDKTFRVELVGVLHHHIYHAGQIAMLKKAIGAQAGRL